MGRNMDPKNEKALEGVDEAAKAAGAATEPQTGTDWKAEARKWEQRAKENKAAADELEALKAAQMTEAEKAAAHLAQVESELDALKAEAKRQADAAEVAKASGAPSALLLYCKDRDAMEAFAADWGAAQKTPPAPAAERSRIAGAGAKPSPSDEFTAYMQNLIEGRGH